MIAPRDFSSPGSGPGPLRCSGSPRGHAPPANGAAPSPGPGAWRAATSPRAPPRGPPLAGGA
eukprot:528786-Prorocentrum_minimum.AAC.1